MKTNHIVLVLFFFVAILAISFFVFRSGEIYPEEAHQAALETRGTPAEIQAGSRTFQDSINLSAAASFESDGVRYIHWEPTIPCAEKPDCFISEIHSSVTFLNVGDPAISAEEGLANIQIANSAESNCANPENSRFSRYIAYAPALKGGQSVSQKTCGENTANNTCDLSLDDGFTNTSQCFSIKITAPNVNQGESYLSANLIFLTYTWQWGNQ